MNEHINVMLEKLLEESADIRNAISEIKVTLACNTKSLEEHMRRTELAEKRIDELDDHINSCPARQQAVAKDHLWDGFQKYSILLGILALLLSEIWPAIKNMFTH